MWNFNPAARLQLTNPDLGISKKLRSTDSKVLELLCTHQGHVVSKQALVDVAWTDRIVTPSSLPQSIAQLRMALGDKGREQKVIKTVPKQGYLLVEGIIEMETPVPPEPQLGEDPQPDPLPDPVPPEITAASHQRRWHKWQQTLLLSLSVLLAFLVFWLARMAYYNGTTERVQWQQSEYQGVRYFYTSGEKGTRAFQALQDRYPDNLLMLYLANNPEQLYVSCIYLSKKLLEHNAINMSFTHDYSMAQVKEAIREQCQ
ncbi:winged helix-turn-helix domain-containing protein [Vibrio pacinii]|uniref:winged helix-turn-helix domain-containing protein n=1 Tax=Vibrio pacinii TaxID=170674 RepID=UPI0005700D44|nr:winged helix-turn-helix domain-containing protein [Vibrio pacinii]